jgi:signal peptidase II
MRSIPRFFVVMITLCCCVGCDQVSKSAARTLLASGVTESLFAAAAAMLIVLVCAALFARRLRPARVIPLALVAGGGISNLIDRLVFDGRVTDFLNVGIGSFRTGIFNLADMAILAGALLLILRRYTPPAAPPPLAPTDRGPRGPI